MKKVIKDFECAMCGQCCANQDLVQLTTYELYKLASHLHMEPGEFFNRHCELGATNLTPTPHLYIKTNNGVCPFLKENKCTVHEARPYACRAYPQRVYWKPIVEMKGFVREKYPMLEATCSLFELKDRDVLIGDFELLSKQTISYWVDDAYFSSAGEQVDLSIPYRVADHYIHDKEMREIGKRYVVNSLHKPSAFGAERAYAQISLTLQAYAQGAVSSFVPILSQVISEDARIGKFLLFKTDASSAAALKMLVESGKMDVARTLVTDSRTCPDRHIVSAVHGSSADGIALGFQFDVESATLAMITKNGMLPLYAFFVPESGEPEKMVGFKLAVKPV
jgi:Fe-S-cluster containining protein